MKQYVNTSGSFFATNELAYSLAGVPRQQADGKQEGCEKSAVNDLP